MEEGNKEKKGCTKGGKTKIKGTSKKGDKETKEGVRN
jgi:hypothetical protein